MVLMTTVNIIDPLKLLVTKYSNRAVKVIDHEAYSLKLRVLTLDILYQLNVFCFMHIFNVTYHLLCFYFCFQISTC